MKQLGVWAILIAVAMGAPRAARAQSPDNVAVIVNQDDESSIKVGEYYVQQRGIPAANVIRLRTSTAETIDRAAYTATIQEPIASTLARGQLQDRILYLVLTKGIPLRISGTVGQTGTSASVDSELTLLYRRMIGTPVLTRGRVDNPYYLGGRPVLEARPFTHRDHDIFLVSRLDGFTAAQAMALVDQAKTAATDGRIVLDQRGNPASRMGDDWLTAAAQALAASGQGDRVLLESTARAARVSDSVLGYYSWGSTDAQNRARSTGLRFAPGALAGSFVSGDARTFQEPPANWVPMGEGGTRSASFEGSTHGVIGDLIRDGVTGVAGHVAEPYLQSVVRPDILFSAYLAGHNLIESYYLALPHLSWQTVIVGDPLCAPFPRKAPDSADLAPALDTATDLPEFFSARRLTHVASTNRSVPSEAITAWVRAVGARGRGDLADARRALERAVELAPSAVGPRADLALLHEANQDIDLAMAQYRKILEVDRNHVVALNNLAYALALQNALAEARPLASRAVTLAPTQANVLDTVGWIEHLRGDDAAAAKWLAEAVRRDPANASIRLHAAIVYGAMGVRSRAETELKEALRLDPALAESEQVRQLKARLATAQ